MAVQGCAHCICLLSTAYYVVEVLKILLNMAVYGYQFPAMQGLGTVFILGVTV